MNEVVKPGRGRLRNEVLPATVETPFAIDGAAAPGAGGVVSVAMKPEIWRPDFLSQAKAARARRVELLVPDARRRIAMLSDVASVHVETGRDRFLDRTFRAFTDQILADPKRGLAPGKVMFITGVSGAGKSRAVRAMLERSAAMQPEHRSYGVQVPWVSVTLGGASTLKRLGHSILRAAGYPINAERREDVWQIVPEVLAAKEVFLVHIDETQHLVRQTEKDHARKELAEALKKAMGPEPWPLSFILSGLPDTIRLAKLDEQFERREMMVSLPSLMLPEDRDVVTKIVREMAEAGGLSAEDVIRSDIPERLTHASNNQFGRVCDAVFLAIRDAVARDAAALTREHFANAYDLTGDSFSDQTKNPFLAANWRALKKGVFIIEPGERRDV